MQRMVVGFRFSEDLSKVALIEKLKPEWQKGLLNGIGGKVEYKETGFEAMVREFYEETGLITTIPDWIQFAYLYGPDWYVDFFYSIGPLEQLKSTTEEQIVIIRLNPDLHNKTFFPMISNLYWLIPMALDHMKEHKFSTVVNYN